jgi:hypothetical protein
MSDLQTFAALCLSTRASRYSGINAKARSVTAVEGMSRAEIMLRLRRCHGLDWPWERVCAVVADMVACGAMVLSSRARGGYRVASWEAIERSAQAVAA